MKRIVLALFIFQLSACAFKSNEAKTTSAGSSKVAVDFIPSDLKIVDKGIKYALMDVISLPAGDYQIDNTLAVKGNVDYNYQYPVFKDTNCAGLGYSVSYEARKKTATTLLKIVPYLNHKAVTLDHVIVAPNEVVQVAIYGEYAPLSDYLDSAHLPNEFIKTLQPSSKCHEMCAMSQVKATREVGFDPVNGISCTLSMWGADGISHPMFPGTITFDAAYFTRDDARAFLMKQLEGCRAVQNNDDLKNYFDQATAGPCRSSVKVMLKEWYYVEQKIPYSNPLYSIANFSDVVKATSATQTEALTDRAIHLSSDWSN